MLRIVDDKKLTAQEVRSWLDAVEGDLRRLGEKLGPLLAEQQRLEERQALLHGLLHSFDQATPNGPRRSEALRATGSVARYVIDRAVEILREEGRPMHINDLHARFVARGFTVPGAGKPVNLTVHLRSAEEIASPTRGIYGLVEQVGAVTYKPPRGKRRKSARSSRAPGRTR
jgi:hypothetical protein